jgi:hypothetical protein
VKIFSCILSSSILSRWPNQLILVPLSTLLYFLLCSSLLVLDSSYFSIPRFHILDHIFFEIFFFRKPAQLVHLTLSLSMTQKPLPDNTHHSQQTNIHSPCGIRTRNLNNRAATNPHFRLRCHWDRHIIKLHTSQPKCIFGLLYKVL